MSHRPGRGSPRGGIMGDVSQAATQAPASRLDELRVSAKGWHATQFALLGFIGLCGVLKGVGTSGGPRWLEISAGILILLALIVACYATFLVGRAAWPLYSAPRNPSEASRPNEDVELRRTGRNLRAGLALTFVAIIMAAAAATSSWWPVNKVSSVALLDVSMTNGFTYCGTWVGSGNGFLLLKLSGQLQEIQLSAVTSVVPTSSCG
jgi:hypothetical protein